MEQKTFAILERDNEVCMIPTSSIFNCVHLSTAEDGAWIMSEDKTLRPTDESFVYPDDYFFNNAERLVLRVDELSDYGYKLSDYPRDVYQYLMAESDSFDESQIEVIDVTELWMSNVSGKAAIIEHGINHDTVIFDTEESAQGWFFVEEVTADYEVEHQQNYPSQEFTVLWHCSNGKTIRETSPFFSDDERNHFEYV